MTQEEKNIKIEKINEIIFLNKISEELWQYHPDNPNKVDVVKDFKTINSQITNLQKEIQDLQE